MYQLIETFQVFYVSYQTNNIHESQCERQKHMNTPIDELGQGCKSCESLMQLPFQLFSKDFICPNFVSDVQIRFTFDYIQIQLHIYSDKCKIISKGTMGLFNLKFIKFYYITYTLSPIKLQKVNILKQLPYQFGQPALS